MFFFSSFFIFSLFNTFFGRKNVVVVGSFSDFFLSTKNTLCEHSEYIFGRKSSVHPSVFFPFPHRHRECDRESIFLIHSSPTHHRRIWIPPQPAELRREKRNRRWRVSFFFHLLFSHLLYTSYIRSRSEIKKKVILMFMKSWNFSHGREAISRWREKSRTRSKRAESRSWKRNKKHTQWGLSRKKIIISRFLAHFIYIFLEKISAFFLTSQFCIIFFYESQRSGRGSEEESENEATDLASPGRIRRKPDFSV